MTNTKSNNGASSKESGVFIFETAWGWLGARVPGGLAPEPE